MLSLFHKGALLFLITCLSAPLAYTQSSSSSKTPISFTLNYFFDGRTTKFGSQHKRTFLEDNPSCIELLINRVTVGNRGWERYWRFPKVGLSIAVVDYNRHKQPEDLGYSISLIPYLHGYLFRYDRWSANYGLGFGGAYQTAIYDPVTNIDNNAISTRITAAFTNDWKLNYQLSPHLTLHAIFALRHFSNGAVRIPNAGANILLWGLGVSYQPVFQPIRQPPDSVWLFKKRVRFNLEFGYNKKGIVPGDFMTYDVFTIGLYANKMVSKINALVAGVDVCHDNSIYNDAMRFEVNKGKPLTPLTNYLVVAYLGNEFFIGRQCSYTTTFGWHVYQEFNIYGKFVHRHTLKWFFTDFLYFKGALKVFSFAADSFDLGLGVRL